MKQKISGILLPAFVIVLKRLQHTDHRVKQKPGFVRVFEKDGFGVVGEHTGRHLFTALSQH